MAGLIAQSSITVLIGMGLSGRSAARYLTKLGRAFVWLDTREIPPGLDDILREFPNVNYELGELNGETLLCASEIVVSPGVPLSTPAIASAIEAGISVLGDVELFCRDVKAPVIAITGSNAKSTVTTLVGEMAAAAGKHVLVGGNIGVPVLDLLCEAPAELYVLELSSFQLETVTQLNADVATILNISEDHMDRYDSLAQYHLAKQRICFGAKTIVINRHDPLTEPPLAQGVVQLSFGLNRPDRGGFGVIMKGGVEQLAFEFKALMPVSEIKMIGRHNVMNALAALALGYGAGLPMEPMLQTLKTFCGLPHRCELVAQSDDVSFYNDSKGTNVGATLAAIEGLKAAHGKIVLIAGGVGKGADFAPLKATIDTLRGLVLIGADGSKIAEQFDGELPTHYAQSMLDAVQKAQSLAVSGDAILLSPACASFDMFKGFEDRGEHFVAAVKEVLSD